MNRRRLLYSSGLIMASTLAGCTGNDSEEAEGGTRDSNSSGDDNNNTTDNKETNENSTTDEGTPAVEIVDHELVVDEGDYITDVYVEAVIENTGDAPSGNIEVQADWYNADGNYLDNDIGWLVSLAPGESWESRVYYLGSNPEEVEDYEFEGEFDEEPADVDPEGVELLGSEMEVGEDEAVVTGEIENTSDETEDYVAAVAKIYDEDGVVLGDNFTNVTELRGGETWSFEVSWRGRDRSTRAADHELLVATTT